MNRREPGVLAFRPLCPRCGYDLSGTCDSWKSECPIEGVCTECGLELLWKDVVDPIRAVPPWFFEHARGGCIGWLVTLVRSLAVALRPARLWTAIRMSFAVNLGRLLVVALLCLGTVHIIVGLQHAFFVHRWSTAAFFMRPSWLELAWYAAWPYVGRRPWVDEIPAAHSPWFIASVVMWLAMPVAFLALPTTLRRCRVRFSHLCRIAAWSLVALPVLTLIFCVLALLLPYAGWRPPDVHHLLFAFMGGFPLACAAWLVLFWSHAAHVYLKLPQATGVVLTMLTISLLLGLAVVGTFHPGFGSNPLTQAIFG